MIQNTARRHSRARVALLLLFFLILIPYSNSFRAAWHFDDFPKIINNSAIKISDLKPQTLYNTFFDPNRSGEDQKRRLYRPIPCLTFALNYYVGQFNVFGYHLVNFTVHYLIACFLFLTLLLLFKTPNLNNRFSSGHYFVALLTTSLWAINPIQTQAVTYIVQRMAALATLFYISGIFCYLKARLVDTGKRQTLYFIGCFVSFVLALGSKENSATLPLALILVEIVFFQDVRNPRVRRRFIRATVITGICFMVFGAFFYLQGDPASILKGYERRSFSPLQRLMTEPRVLLFYISQILYPVPTRLSIEHYVPVSTSLFAPWTTLPSILIVLMLIVFAFYQMSKRPILSFAILFFFLNHVIESTIFGLELIFEHRNYLPSLFSFFPISIGIKWLVDQYKNRKRSMYLIITGFVTVLILGLGMGTYLRNLVWATEKTLWEDAIQKAPEMTRPYHNLAWGHYEKVGQFDMARALYEKCIGLLKHTNHGKALVYNNLANLYYRHRDLRKASELWTTAVRLNPEKHAFEYRLAKCLAEMNAWDRALFHFDRFLLKYPNHRNALSLKGITLLKQNKLEQARPCFRRVLKWYPNDKFALANLGIGFRLLGNYAKAEWYLNAAHGRAPNNTTILLWLIETNLVTMDQIDVDKHMQKLFALSSFDELTSQLNNLKGNRLMPDDVRQNIITSITARIKTKSSGLDHLTDLSDNSVI
jgi:tetratricopeptide (TPR) repeat protein